MHTTGVTDLRASLTETLARVKAGEEVLVTEHGRPIAKIVKIVPVSTVAPDASLEDLVRAGILRAPVRKFDEEFWNLPRPDDPEGLVRKALRDEP